MNTIIKHSACVLLLTASFNVNANISELAFLQTLGGTNSFATAIDNQNEVVGWSYLAGDTEHKATLWEQDANAFSFDENNLFSVRNDSTALSISHAAGNSTFITGWSIDDNGTKVPTLWAFEGVSRLDGLGSDITGQANGISISHNAVGYSINNNNQKQATYWIDLGTQYIVDPLQQLPGNESVANAINSNEMIVGYGVLADGTTRQAATWDGNSLDLAYTLLDAQGGVNSNALAISDAGNIVGYSDDSSSTALRAALWQSENGGSHTLSLLSTLGGTTGQANALNESLDIVGVSANSNNEERATLWRGTNSIIDLNDHIDPTIASAGWVLIEATDINEAGFISGNAINTNTNQRSGFVLEPVTISSSKNTVTPVPEPSQIFMLLGGLCIVAWRTKQFKT